MIEADPGNIAAGLRNRAAENEAAQNLINSQLPNHPSRLERIPGQLAPNEHPGPDFLSTTMQQWAHAAPTLPAGALLSVSQAGINPFSPLGTYLLNNAVPALLYKPTSPAEAAGLGIPGSAGYALKNLFNDPSKLEQLKQLPLDQLSTLKADPQSLPKIEQAGIGPTSLPDPNDIWSHAIGGVREVGAVAQSGLELASAAGRQQLAGLTKTASNVVTGQDPNAGKTAGGVPYDPQQYIIPKVHVPGNVADIPGVNQIPGIKESPFLGGHDVGGAQVNFGDQKALTDIVGQTTVGQQLQGKDLGHGILPGGTAVEDARKAQAASATVAGHVLTPGRVLASFVATPDSLAYRAVSGYVDAQVALHADPALLATEAITGAVRARSAVRTVTADAVSTTADHLIDMLGPDNAQALRDWAGDGGDLRTAIEGRLTHDPVSINELITNGTVDRHRLAAAIVGQKAGLLHGLYQSVHPDTFLQHLVSPEGDKFFQTMADHGFTDIGHKTGWTMDAKLHLALADAKTGDEARQALQDHLSSITKLPTVGFHPITDMRWNSILPTKMADVKDANSMLARARQDLQLLKVPRAEWDNYLPQVVKSEGDYTNAFNAFKQIGNAGADKILSKVPGYTDMLETQAGLKARVKALGDHVVPTAENQGMIDSLANVTANVEAHQHFARRLTNYWYEKGNQSRLWHNAELGGAQLLDGLGPTEGAMTAVEGPFGVTELLNRGIPTLGGGRDNIRNVQRAVGTWAPLFNSPVLGAVPRAARSFLVDMIADNLTDVMKTFALAHVGTGVRIFGSQAARMAAAGVGDLSKNPIGLTGLIGGVGDFDITGEQLLGRIGDHQNALAAAVGQAADWRNELAGNQKWFTKGWSNFNPLSGSPDAIDAWANRLSHTSAEPVASEVAKALTTGETLDAVKQSVWDGPLARTRAQMIRANVTWSNGDYVGYSRDLAQRSNSDAWVEGWAKIVQNETANHPDLLQAVADGVGRDISDPFRRQLSRLARDGIAPRTVTGPIPFDGKTIANPLKRAVSAMLAAVAGGPTKKLLEIPTAKRLYFNEVERLLPYLSEADAESIRGLAAGYGVTLPDVAKDVTHTIGINEADLIAKAHAAHGFQKIFYNPGRKTILVDQLRDLIPFANVISNTATSWAKLVAQNPKVLRVVQMGVTDAQQSGWWNKDQYGKQQMTLIPGDAINSMLGVNQGLTGEASRLNVVTQGWPSVGPVVSLSAPDLLAAFGKNDLSTAIMNYTNPYGDPTAKGNLLNILFPGWYDKAVTSGYLANIPVLSSIGTPDAYQQRLLNQTAMQAMRWKMSTGHINMSDTNAMQDAWKQSLQAARYMFLIRGFAQFAAPVAPQFDPQLQLKDGSVIQQYLVSNDYNAMYKANGNDTYKTTLQFINKYGPDQIFAVQPFTRPLVYGLPTTAEAEAWKSMHGDFAAKFSSVYGYFAPQQGGFDYPAYLKQIATGERQPLTGPQWYSLAEARIGNAQYDQLRKALPAHLNSAQQAIVAAYKASLTKQFPGFNEDKLKLAKDTSPQTITEFQNAIHDPAVQHTPLAKAIDQFLQVRDAVLAKQKDMGLSAQQISTSGQAAGLRDVLYKWGTQLASQHPEFSNVWQNVFSYEVQNQQTQDLQAAG